MDCGVNVLAKYYCSAAIEQKEEKYKAIKIIIVFIMVSTILSVYGFTLCLIKPSGKV